MLVQSLNGAWQFRQSGSAEWLPGCVPGGVHTDLLSAGRIPDPFVGDNELKVQWVAEADWQYRLSFQPGADLLDAQQIYLACDGLDTLAEVRLNGVRVGQAENMFRPYRWEVKRLLKPGENLLEIDFASPVRYCAGRNQERPLAVSNDSFPGAPYLRKAPCHFGWDWGPKLPPVGIWGEVRLEGYTHARLEDVHVRQQHQDGQVSLLVTVQAERWTEAPLRAVLRLYNPDGSPAAHTVPVSCREAEAALVGEQASLNLAVPDPQLWWPNGCGAQPLYHLEVSLLEAESDLNSSLDRRSLQLGLRTLELRQEPDSWGRSFTFVVNGVPLFAKGANWIPADSFPTRVSPAWLERLLSAAAAAHMNMLRVWGGGYYESEAFYDLCDRYGLLVWQDFMFACATYPLDEPAFLENVRQEVRTVVRRLRSRACLALWCGNNEIESGWAGWGWSRPETAALQAADARFFYITLPGWVAEEDPATPYWPGSPSSDLAQREPNSDSRGDNHLWEVWHENLPFRAYRQRFPRFASEFGFQSLPPLATIAGYADPAEWNLTSYIMEHHQRNPAGNGKMITYITQLFRLPRDFASLVYLTQVQQAEAMRLGVEHWRRSRERCSGALYWQLNDCWPVASWSSLDYHGRRKALHYAARRFYNPLLLSVEDDGPRLKIFFTNDTPQPWQGEVRWWLETLVGKALESGRQAVSAAPLATTPVVELDFSPRLAPETARRSVFVAELWQGEALLGRVVQPFVPDKHLELGEPHLAPILEQVGEELVITLKAASLARFVCLELEEADVIFSDNYFDLPAGRTARLTCPPPAGWTLSQARQALHVRSLKESY